MFFKEIHPRLQKFKFMLFWLIHKTIYRLKNPLPVPEILSLIKIKVFQYLLCPLRGNRVHQNCCGPQHMEGINKELQQNTLIILLSKLIVFPGPVFIGIPYIIIHKTHNLVKFMIIRSEERRVGKECRSWW